jgi:hypothetical protein
MSVPSLVIGLSRGGHLSRSFLQALWRGIRRDFLATSRAGSGAVFPLQTYGQQWDQLPGNLRGRLRLLRVFWQGSMEPIVAGYAVSWPFPGKGNGPLYLL